MWDPHGDQGRVGSSTPIASPTATLLADGDGVLVAGGYDERIHVSDRAYRISVR